MAVEGLISTKLITVISTQQEIEKMPNCKNENLEKFSFIE